MVLRTLLAPAPRVSHVLRLFPLLLALAGVGVRATAHSPETAEAVLAAELTARANALSPDVLRLALRAVACASRDPDARRPDLLTVIDYSRPSTEPRLWVLDLVARRLLFEEPVAHGRNTGENLATSFSNRPGSHQSSLGLFVTGATYTGSNGYSLRLHGLEPGVNDRALERAIVMHGAAYVRPESARRIGRLGRSWGCPAVRPSVARQLIDTIKGGSFVFAYYPDAGWLGSSRFLSACE